MLNPFNKPEEQDVLEKAHSTLRAKAEVLGKNAGLKDLPSDSQTLLQHLGPITGGYRNLINMYCKKPSGKEDTIATLKQKSATEKQVHLSTRLQKLQDKEQTLLLEREELPEVEGEEKASPWIHIMIVCIALFEAIFSRKAASVFDSGNNIIQIIIIWVLTAIFIALPHGLVRVYRNTKHSQYRLFIWGGITVIILAGFFALAQMRSLFIANLSLSSVEKTTTGPTLTLAPIYFIFIQTLLLFISTMCASFLPSSEDKKRGSNIKNIDKRIADTQAEISRIENELGGAISERSLREEMSKADSEARTEAMRERIKSMFEESAGVFVSTNARWRKTPMPECMNNIPEL